MFVHVMYLRRLKLGQESCSKSFKKRVTAKEENWVVWPNLPHAIAWGIYMRSHGLLLLPMLPID